MAKTYYLSTTNSDLSLQTTFAPASFSKVASESTETAGTISVTVGSGNFGSGFAITASGAPSSSGSYTGTFTVETNVTTANSNFTINTQLVRLGTYGNILGIADMGANLAASTTGVKSFSYTNPIELLAERAPFGIFGTYVYYNNGFVVSGVNGGLLTSTAGSSWTYQNLGLGYTDIRAIAYNGTKYVAICSARLEASTSLLIASSANKINWSIDSSIPVSVVDIAYGNSIFVTVGNGGAIYTSPDGITWTSRTSGTTQALNCVVYLNNLFLIGGNSGVILTSSDGITWTLRNPGTSTNITGIAWNGTIYAASNSGNGNVYTSPDTITWTARNTGNNLGIANLVYGNGAFIFATSGGSNGYVYKSTDGITWTGTLLDTTNAFDDIEFGDVAGTPTFVVTSAYKLFYTTDTGSTWIDAGSSNGVVAATPSDIAFAGTSTYIVTLGNGNVIRSTNGTNWSTVTTGASAPLNGITYGNGIFVAVGTGGIIYTSSTGGASWTSRTSGTVNSFNAVTWSGSLFVAIGESGTILTSPDGTTWTSRTSGTTVSLQNVVWGNNLFVVCGGTSTGTILTSPDGVTWTSRTSNSAGQLLAIVWSGSLFVSVGQSGSIVTSSDGVTWTLRTINSTTDMNAISYGGGVFLATIDSSTLNNATTATSYDGINWTVRQINDSQITSNSGTFCRYLNGSFYYGGVDAAATPTALITSTNSAWSSGDRFAAKYNFYNSAMNTQTVVIQTGTTDTEIITPFYPTPSSTNSGFFFLMG